MIGRSSNNATCLSASGLVASSLAAWYLDFFIELSCLLHCKQVELTTENIVLNCFPS
jgi:hypothetical protein